MDVVEVPYAKKRENLVFRERCDWTSSFECPASNVHTVSLNKACRFAVFELVGISVL